VRLESHDPADVGKAAICASDVRAFGSARGFAIVSYQPDIHDMQVMDDWAAEWGVFDAGFRSSANAPVNTMYGKVLRVLHRERSGEWKFSRLMVVQDAKPSGN
jgi:hypothetical protein